MRLTALRTPWTARNLKVCLISAVASLTVFVLDKGILSPPVIHKALEPLSDVQESFRPLYTDVHEYFKASSLEVPEFFKPLVTAEEYREMQDLVRTFSAAMKNASLTYFLAMGSLLGSWRHHGLVPWDDDVDMGVLSREKESVRTVLENLTPNYFLALGAPLRWKFYSSRGQKAGQDRWNWPYIDISLYDQDSTQVWDPTEPWSYYPINDVYPLRERPFMGMMLFAPKDTEAMLTRYFQTSNLTLCKPTKYDHRRERRLDIDIDKLAVPCKQLHSVYPFVWRQPARGGLEGCNESLVTNSSVLSWLVLNTTRC